MKLMSLFNIRSEHAQNHPFIGVVDLSISKENMIKYEPVDLKRTDDITPEVLTSFVSAFANKELTPILKSDPEPTSPAPKDLPILALNTHTFKTVFGDYPDKDIFIFFAGPACFNCNAVWPSFELTVRALHEGSKSLLFAYVDLTYNELQEYAVVYSFPSIRLYPKNENPERPEKREVAINFEEQPEYSYFKSFLMKHVKGGEIVADPT